MILYTLLQIDPTKAVSNLSDLGAVGAMLVVMLAAAFFSIKWMKSSIEIMFKKLNDDIQKKDDELTKSNLNFIEFLKVSNAKQADALEHNTIAFNKLVVIFEMLEKKL